MAKQWYWIQCGQKRGPIDTAGLKTLIKNKQLKRTDLVRREGLSNWVAAGKEKEIFPDETLVAASPAVSKPDSPATAVPVATAAAPSSPMLPAPSAASEPKCSDCKHRRARNVCGQEKSSSCGQVVDPGYSCPHFLANPAQGYFTAALAATVNENQSPETIVSMLEAAIQGGLPQDDEILARRFLAPVCLDLAFKQAPGVSVLGNPLLLDAFKHMEYAIKTDSEQSYGVFKDPLNRSMLVRFDACYAMQGKQLEETRGSDAKVAYLEEKLSIYERVPDYSMIYVLESLGVSYYNDCRNPQRATACFQRILNSEPIQGSEEDQKKMKDRAREHLAVLGEQPSEPPPTRGMDASPAPFQSEARVTQTSDRQSHHERREIFDKCINIVKDIRWAVASASGEERETIRRVVINFLFLIPYIIAICSGAGGGHPSGFAMFMVVPMLVWGFIGFRWVLNAFTSLTGVVLFAGLRTWGWMFFVGSFFAAGCGAVVIPILIVMDSIKLYRIRSNENIGRLAIVIPAVVLIVAFVIPFLFMRGTPGRPGSNYTFENRVTSPQEQPKIPEPKLVRLLAPSSQSVIAPTEESGMPHVSRPRPARPSAVAPRSEGNQRKAQVRDLDRQYWELSRKGDDAGAIKMMDEAIALDSSTAAWFKQRGMAKARMRDNAGALADLRKSVELSQGSYYFKNDLDRFLQEGVTAFDLKPKATPTEVAKTTTPPQPLPTAETKQPEVKPVEVPAMSDVDKSLAELRAKAENGDYDAQRLLGNRYAKGEGVPKDEVEAVKWYRKAADQNRPAAQRSLAYCYADGLGVTKDEVEAYKWWLLAGGGETGRATAKKKERMAALERSLTPEQQAEAKRRADEWRKQHDLKPQTTEAPVASTPAMPQPTAPAASQTDSPRRVESTVSSQPSTPAPDRTNSLEIVSVTPPSPAVLKVGDKMEVRIRFSKDSRDPVLISAVPLTKGRPTAGCTFGQQQRKVRNGEVTGWFSFQNPATVDEVRITMVDAGTREQIKTISQRIHAQWRKDGGVKLDLRLKLPFKSPIKLP